MMGGTTLSAKRAEQLITNMEVKAAIGGMTHPHPQHHGQSSHENEMRSLGGTLGGSDAFKLPSIGRMHHGLGDSKTVSYNSL